MLSLEAHLNERRVRARVRGVHRGEPRRRTDIGDDDPQVFVRHYRTDHLLHLAHEALGKLEPGSGRRLQIDHELSRIGAREVRLSDQGIQTQTQGEDAGDPQHGRSGSEKSPAQRALIPIEHASEASIEPGVEAPGCAHGPSCNWGLHAQRLGAFSMRPLDPLGAEQRNDGHGYEIGRRQRQHHR